MKKEKILDRKNHEAEQTSGNDSIKKTKKKSKTGHIKWLGAILVVIVIFFGFQYFSFVKKAEARREAQAEQEQLLVTHWEEQGLPEEEIQEKLRESRSENFDPEDAPLVFQLMRSFRHATGTGPGTGGSGAPMGGGDGSGTGGMGMRGGGNR